MHPQVSVPVPTASPDGELLDRLRAGDDAAYEHLVRTHTPHLLAIARRISRSEADAEDIVQESFLSAFRAIDRFDGRSSLGTWLHRIVVNAALSRARKAQSRREHAIEDLLPHFEAGRHESSPAPWRSVTSTSDSMDPDLKNAVRDAIEKLPADFREAVLLRDVEGLPSSEIAASLGISDGLVRQRVHRARQALMTLLTPALKEIHQ